MGRKVERIWPRHVQTVRAMRADNVPVFASCNRCGGSFKVNLELLERAYGPHLSLINRVGPCPVLACEGSCHFLAQTGDGVPFIPLRDRDWF